MPFVASAAMQAIAVDAACPNGDLVRLVTAAPGTITPDSTIADFTVATPTECTKTVTSWSDSYTSPKTTRTGNPVLFTADEGGSWGLPLAVVGYILTDYLGNYKGGEKFTGGTFTFTYTGQTLQITPKVDMGDA